MKSLKPLEVDELRDNLFDIRLASLRSIYTTLKKKSNSYQISDRIATEFISVKRFLKLPIFRK